MAKTNRSTIPLPLFNGENYDFRSIKMGNYFCSQNLWKVVEEGLTVPNDTSTLTAAQKKSLDEKKILISCTEKYDSVISAIEESKDIKTLTPTELMGSLEAHEKRINRQNENTTESAFPSKINMQSQKSKVEKDCWFKPKSQCRNCKKYGHVEKYCRLKRNHQANFSEEKEGNYLFHVSQNINEETKDVWFLDSGCSNHMTKDEIIFCNIDKIKTKVKIGNGEFVEAIGKGTIAVDTKQGKRYISEVLLVLNIAQNLLSVGQMVEKGYSLHFEGNSYTIYDKKDKSLIIARVKMQENRCFPIEWRYAIDIAMKAQVDESWLWHRRFKHFNFHGLKKLRQKNMMRDLPTIKEMDETCEGFMLGKQHRQPFPSKKAWRAKKPLELVHIDVCGPMRTPSNGQNRYFIIFIDDYTIMTWVYFLRE
ncbi:hypothetical protein UlMin_024202 [Ulmus minor]